MKLARIGAPGKERPVMMVGAQSAVYVDDVIPDFGRDTIGELDRLRGLDIEGRDVIDTTGQRFGAPVARPTKVICVGLNYRAHALESGLDIPTEPVLFMKAPDTVQGPNDDIAIPPGSEKSDYEVEMAIVIKDRCSYLPDTDAARAVIAGYATSQDVSERHWQLERGGQWDKGKSFPTFNPLGPWLVTPDEFDPLNARAWCSVNGEIRQDSNTADMIFDVYEIVRYISNVMELFPGDVINTGTPQGVGMGWNPPRYLRVGDRIETEVVGLGRQEARTT